MVSNTTHAGAAPGAVGFGRAIGAVLVQLRQHLPAVSVRPAAMVMVLAASAAALSGEAVAQTAEQMKLGNPTRDAGIGAVLGVVGAKLLGAQPLAGAVIGAVSGAVVSRPLALANEEYREGAAFHPPAGDVIPARISASLSSALVSATARRLIAQDQYARAQTAEMDAEIAAMNFRHRPGDSVAAADVAGTEAEFRSAKVSLDSAVRALNSSLMAMNRVLTLAERQYPGSAHVAAVREIYKRRLSQQMGVVMTLDHWPDAVRAEVSTQAQMASSPDARVSLDSVRGDAPRAQRPDAPFRPGQGN